MYDIQWYYSSLDINPIKSKDFDQNKFINMTLANTKKNQNLLNYKIILINKNKNIVFLLFLSLLVYLKKFIHWNPKVIFEAKLKIIIKKYPFFLW